MGVDSRTAAVVHSRGPEPRSRRIEAKRIALVAAVLLSDLLFAGIVWGWAPFLLLLHDERQYVELRDFGGDLQPTRTCVAQENQLNLVFAASVAVMCAMSLPIGMFLDRAGPKIVSAFAGVIVITGLLLLAFADSQTLDVFVPAYVMLGFGGSMTLLASFPVSFVLVEHQIAVLAAVNCLFDGSCAVFLVLYAIKSHFDVSRQRLLCGLAAVAVVNYVALIVLWHVNGRGLRGPIVTDSCISEHESLRAPNLPTTRASESEADLQDTSGPIVETTVVSVDYGSATTEGDSEDSRTRLAEHKQHRSVHTSLVDAPICEQLQSPEFTYIVVFGGVQMLRASVYIGTANILLVNYGDWVHDFVFAEISSVILPMGFIFVPAVDYAVGNKGLAFALFLTNVLGVVYNLVALVRNLYAQCVTSFVFAAFRVTLFTVVSVFTAKIFGLQNMGTLMGTIFTLGAVANMAEYPAVYVSNAYFGGELTVVHSITLALCGLLFPYTEWMRRREDARSHKPI